jgi:peptidoglycan lytic transglycosylase
MKFYWSNHLRISSLVGTVLIVGCLAAPSNVPADTTASKTSSDMPSRSDKTNPSGTTRTVTKAAAPGDVIKGKASWYGPGLQGKKTSTGERFNSNAMTAASNKVPLGSKVVVTNLDNGKSATVRVNDCGPNRRGRKIDVSKKAARNLGMTHDGTAHVTAEVISTPADAETCDDMKKAAR